MSGIILLIMRGLLIVVLYLFLILIIMTTWKMLNSGSGTENEVIHLVRMDTGEKYTYKLHTIRIGSDSSNDLRINSPVILPFHAVIKLKKKQWWIELVNQNSSIQVNGNNISGAMQINASDEIALSDFRILVTMSKTQLGKKAKRSK